MINIKKVIDKFEFLCYHKTEVITMKFIQKLANERFARHAARLMKFACYFVICFYVLCTV